MLDYIEKHDLCKNADERGKQLRSGLRDLQTRHGVIGDVRGLGLMDGAEFIHTDGAPAPELLDDVLEEMKDRVYIIGKNGAGRNVMAFQPPLVITEQNVDDVLDELDRVLTEKHL